MRIAENTFMKWILVAILSTFLTSQASLAEIYKWVDEKGAIHFTDDITQVPEKYRPKAEEIRSSGVENEETKEEGQIAPKIKEGTYKDQSRRGEDYWKGRVEEWKRKLEEQRDRLRTLQVKYNQLIMRFNESKSSAERGDIRKESEQVKNEMDQCTTQIEEARDMIERTIPEEAELYKANPQWVK